MMPRTLKKEGGPMSHVVACRLIRSVSVAGGIAEESGTPSERRNR
ncbi:unnamed protein product [Amoebophrya sp. A25]|nr:unnamed protein product [Amoebophrya sp. A25]|eukprot:GSA25T00016061001.1